MSFSTNAEITVQGGKLYKLSHDSTTTNTKMDVNVYVPPSQSEKIPVLMFLSGLTCTPNNATEKSFLTYFAAKYGFALVFPDTSPRGAGIAGEDDSYDFGTGAGFYLDATQAPWSKNYNMYSYVHKELLDKLAEQFTQLDFTKISITGHSMGGYGAIAGFFKNPGKYTSVSAFAPISNPLNCAWGEKNFSAHLGNDKTEWLKYDPVNLIKHYSHEHQPDILIHQGAADDFYKRDHFLQPENLVAAAAESNYKGKIDLHVVDGYDHLYFFISSFAEAHAKHHAKALGLLE